MGSAVFTLLAVYVAITNRPERWVVIASSVAALFMFLVAAFLAWRDEHLARIRTEDALREQTPDFGLVLGQAVSIYDATQDHTLVVLVAELTNRGANSAAVGWSAHYVSQTLDTGVELKNLLDPELRLPFGGGKYLAITQKDLIHAKTVPTVPRAHNVGGRLVLAVPGDRRAEINGGKATIVVSCEDYTRRRCSAFFNPSGAQPLQFYATERIV
jgi:hypothetical protein